MKKYIELEIELIVLQEQDIITNSVSGAFDGEVDSDGFGNPNDNQVGGF